jgi:hypothetical protein
MGQSAVHFSAIFRRLAFVVPLLALAAWAHAAGLYTGQVPVNSQADGERAEALKSALAQVVVKLTGDAAVLSRPEVAKAVASAQQYVQQYQYAQDVTTGNGVPQTHLSLIAQFDRDAVDKMLGDLGVAHAGGNAAQAAVDMQPQSYRVWVGGVHSATDYAQVVGTLSRNDLVRSVQAEQARGDGVELLIDVTGPLPRLLDSLGGGSLHVVNAKPPVDGVDALLSLQQP